MKRENKRLKWHYFPILDRLCGWACTKKNTSEKKNYIRQKKNMLLMFGISCLHYSSQSLALFFFSLPQEKNSSRIRVFFFFIYHSTFTIFSHLSEENKSQKYHWNFFININTEYFIQFQRYLSLIFSHKYILISLPHWINSKIK